MAIQERLPRGPHRVNTQTASGMVNIHEMSSANATILIHSQTVTATFRSAPTPRRSINIKSNSDHPSKVRSAPHNLNRDSTEKPRRSAGLCSLCHPAIDLAQLIQIKPGASCTEKLTALFQPAKGGRHETA